MVRTSPTRPRTRACPRIATPRRSRWRSAGRCWRRRPAKGTPRSLRPQASPAKAAAAPAGRREAASAGPRPQRERRAAAPRPRLQAATKAKRAKAQGPSRKAQGQSQGAPKASRRGQETSQARLARDARAHEISPQLSCRKLRRRAQARGAAGADRGAAAQGQGLPLPRDPCRPRPVRPGQRRHPPRRRSAARHRRAAGRRSFRSPQITQLPRGPRALRARLRLGQQSIPGSPVLAAQALRAQDRGLCCEMLAAECRALERALGRFPRMRCECVDGYRSLRRASAAAGAARAGVDRSAVRGADRRSGARASTRSPRSWPGSPTP